MRWGWVLSSLLTLVCNLAYADLELNKDYNTPTRLLEASQYPNFSDDLNFDEMPLALERQIKRFRQRNLNGSIQLGEINFQQTKLLDTLISFDQDVKNMKKCLSTKPKSQCNKWLDEQVKKNYYVFVPNMGSIDYKRSAFAHFTAYYTPTLKASMNKTKKKPYAIYNMPKEGYLKSKTRDEIDFLGALNGHNYEMFYTKDMFELYLMQIEGGGKVVIENGDGSTKNFYLSYAGTNRRSWRFISKYMFEKGMIQDRSVASQRDYLNKNPNKWREIYSYCPSYVYFKVTEDPPLGSDMVSLTDNRSIATDYRKYSLKGTLSFIRGKRPNPVGESGYKIFSRFMIDQDTGGAIKGNARADLYFGEGEYAEKAANSVNNKGQMFFLIKK